MSTPTTLEGVDIWLEVEVARLRREGASEEFIDGIVWVRQNLDLPWHPSRGLPEPDSADGAADA